ncbi:MAG: Trans-2,3-dihydro-3-hydroxyanthranilate isomerase [Candidatus Marinimicrobia bacterium]|nr:Trans-2,3-dihydro-3-hydroxyanthranilate isomerase [Candidatus Neomarinimicrobiota bacterium]
MKGQPFYLVDVFAEEEYTGNQLAVFPDAGELSVDEMLQLAWEMHYSETTFITGSQQPEGGFPVRIFTPQEELPFAGHPTLGTAFVVREYLMDDPPDEVVLNLGVGQIPVNFEKKSGALWMTQRRPEFGEIIDRERVAKALNLSPNDFHADYPVQSVSTGIPFLIAPLTSLEAVQECGLNYEYYPTSLDGLDTKAILIFAPETIEADNDLHARVFAEYYGVSEDPATGSANGCLAAYLSYHTYFGRDDINVRVEQGYEIHRPSLLHLRTKIQDEKIVVQVGGNVIPVARGNLL